MKKKWSSYVTAFAAASLLMFASCSNITSGELSDDSASELVPGGISANLAAKTVYAQINGIPDSETLQEQIVSSSRTILPTPQAVTGTGASSLIFVLEGTSTNGNEIKAQKVDVSSGAAAGQGKIAISFPDTSLWQLTLTAYKTPDDTGVQAKDYKDGTTDAKASDPVLTATTEVSFTNGTPTVTFNMNVKGLETPGNVEIKETSGFKVAKTSVAITKYEIGLYDIVTGAQITNKAATPADATTGKQAVTIGDFEGSATEKTVNFTADATHLATVAPGQYVLGVTFYNTYNSNDYQVGFWSDYVVVAPGQTTDFDTIITGLDEKPADPTDFKADLVENSENNGTYLVKLTWSDVAKNESNYEIDLYEVTDDAKDVGLDTDTIKTAANATKLATLGFKSLYSDEDAETNKIVDFKDGSLYYGAGSLFASSESATLKLDTGKIYEVVIRAVKNSTDKSNDVAREASTTATVGYKAGTNHINRVRLSYITTPYTITVVGSAVGQQYVTYKTYESAAIALMTTADFTLSYKGTDLDAANFKKWIDAKDGETEVTDTTYKNVNVLAEVAYDIDADVNTYEYATDVTKEFVELIPVKKVDDSDDTALTISDDKIATVNATTYKALKVTAKDAATPAYSSYAISLDGMLYTQESTCTLYLNRLATGTHNIVVAGEKADGTGKTTLYSYSFTLKVER